MEERKRERDRHTVLENQSENAMWSTKQSEGEVFLFHYFRRRGGYLRFNLLKIVLTIVW